MRKGQRASSSSESQETQLRRSTDPKDQLSPRGQSSDEDSSFDSDAEAESAMKRSQRFSSSFSFGEDHQSKEEDREEDVVPEDSDGVTESSAECVQQQDALCDTHPPLRSGLLRPQELWLAMTRCLSLRWRPCLSINRQSHRKFVYQVDQSEDTLSSISSRSTNESSSSTSTSDDREVTSAKLKEEEVGSRGAISGPPRRRWVSRSSPRLQRARPAADSALASSILEKETFLRIELVDSGVEKDDVRYRAEWKLSERTRELAEGVWISRSQMN